MILLADLGNTRLKLALLEASGCIRFLAAPAHADSDFAAALQSHIDRLGSVRAVWMVSSVPSALGQRVETILARTAPVLRARVEDGMDGLRLAYREPQRLGVDRFLALLGARARDVDRGLVVLVGTAMTVDALEPGGRHVGGLILPSPQRMRAALHRDAPHLPEQGGDVSGFATNTDDALASGCILAAVSLIERCGGQLRGGGDVRLLLAGGGADALMPWLAEKAESCPDLVLEGLARWGELVAPSGLG